MPKKVSSELKARAIRLVQEHQQDYPSPTAAAQAVAKQLGLGRETVRRWEQAEVDGGTRSGVSSVERFKTECIGTRIFQNGPYKTSGDVEYATAEWVDW